MKKLVIMPGGFHPFHQGHLALYDAAKKAFPDADVYVAATNETGSRPFPFAVKQKLAKLAGVPADKFVQVKSPFRAQEITQAYDPNGTALIFVRSDKDRDEAPKPGGVKKDGTPGYLQPYTGKDLKPMTQQGYMAYLPTVEFAGGITSATEIRSQWPSLKPEGKAELVHNLYPKTASNEQMTQTVIKTIDKALGVPAEPVKPTFESQFNELLEKHGFDKERSQEYLAKMQEKLAKQREKTLAKYVKEGKPETKPRNFVAKNAQATTSGAGAHKDKKKAQKQGDQKHKKDLKRVDYIDEATYRTN